MIAKAPTHIAFADESHHNTGQYRSVAMISMPCTQVDDCTSTAIDVLSHCKNREFKWHGLYGADSRNAVLKMLECVVEKADQRSIRIDALVWDIRDSRHDISGRDDTENLHRMYYHLLRTTMKYRWPNDAVWRICPDENTSMRWTELADILRYVSLQSDKKPDLFNQIDWGWDFIHEFHVESITPMSSHAAPMVQIADLFAGLAVFSRECYSTYVEWQITQQSQMSLVFDDEEDTNDFTRSQKVRCRILYDFNNMCKARKMRVSLKSHSGLKTMDPNFPINFWWYEPQHDADKAPVKQRRSDT